MNTYKPRYTPRPGYSYIFKIIKKTGECRELLYKYLGTVNGGYDFDISNPENFDEPKTYRLTPYRFNTLFKDFLVKSIPPSATKAEAENVEVKREAVRAATERAEETEKDIFEVSETENANRQAIEELKNISTVEAVEIKENMRIDVQDLATEIEVMLDEETNLFIEPNRLKKSELFRKASRVLGHIAECKFNSRQAKAVKQC